MAADDALQAIAVLERRYDGPVPAPMRRIARLGSATRLLQCEADARAELFAALVRDQIEAIRRARRDGPISARLLADLALYRRHGGWWRREAARLRRLTPSAADAP